MEINKKELKFKNTLQKRKNTTQIIIHCTGGYASEKTTVETIHNMHLKNGWSGIGYHFLITVDGKVWQGRPDDTIGAHAAPLNNNSIGICYVGGLSQDKKHVDTRTPEQKKAMDELVAYLVEKYPSIVRIIGHRDISPDLDGDGIIEPNEFIKSCPCFDVIPEYIGFLG